MADYTELILGILTLVAIPLVKFGWDKYSRKRIKNSIGNRSDVYAYLLDLLHEVDANRVFISFAHNDGGIPSENKQTYTSILYERTRKDQVPIKDTWQKETTDSELSKILDMMVKRNFVVVDVEDMEDESKMKNACLALGLSRVVFWQIGFTNKKFFYLVGTWQDRKGPLSPKNSDMFRVTANKVRRHLLK